MDEFLTQEELEAYEERQEAQRLAARVEAGHSLEVTVIPSSDDPVSALTEENKAEQEEEREAPILADDIQNLVLRNREYTPVTRTTEYDFTCDIRGEHDILHYLVEYHDEGEGFTIHTEKDGARI